MTQPDIYSTQNAGLAMALLAGGLQFLPECPVFHLYRDEFLRRNGATSFEDARTRVIPRLKQMKLLGEVTYNFAASPLLETLKQAYDDQQKKMRDGETVILPNITPEEAVRLAATIQHNRGACLAGLLAMQPMIVIARGEGFVAVPANASDRILEHFDLK